MQQLKLSILILILFFVNNTHAQNKQIRVYNLEDGLPQSQVYDIVQDDYGYIWLGTQGGGIARFDGNQFKVWNEKKGLISNYINALAFKNNTLYIGTKHGLSVKTKNKFSNYESPQINKIVSKNNRIYIATNRGLYEFKDKLYKLKILKFAVINDILYRNNWFWFATDKGLWKISEDFSTKIKLSKHNFKSITYYKQSVFCASFNNGIYIFDEEKSIVNPVSINNTKRINSLSILNESELWIATDNNGITIINASDYGFIKKIDKQNALPISHIRKCISDNQSNIWLASSGGGIFKLFENNFTHYDKNNGLKGNRVYAVHNTNGAIYISNSEEGLLKIDSLGLHPIQQDNNFLNVKVKTIASDTNGNLFAGTEGKGILVIHNSVRNSIINHLDENNFIVQDSIQVNHQFTDTLDTKKGLPFDWIKKIIVKNNKIWVASYSSGIASFNYDTSEKEIINLVNFGSNNNLKDLFINDIAFDTYNTLWYVTKKGVIGTIKNNKVTNFGKAISKNTSIRTLLFHNNQLFLGTSGKGIWWSNLSKPLKFTQLIGKKELYSNNIYQLIFDADNQLWAGSENGIDKITLDTNNLIIDVDHFGRNDGFLGIETCLNAVVKDRKDNLWFGTIYGLTKYQPTTTELQQQKPKLFFEEIEVMNTSLDSIPLQELTSTKHILHLNPNQNLLGFYYKTVDLNNPKELQYRWKIDDYKWSNWNSDTKVNIASDYGKHKFSAQSRNLDWTESEIITLQFNRKKPLLKETWFLWLTSSIFGLLLLLFSLLYFKRLKAKNKKEKEYLQLQNDLLTLEQKALRLQMNPHFIFNVLNGIKAMSISDVKTMHTTINKFASLLRATLTNSRKDNITLAQEVATLKNYIEVEQLMSEKPFTYNLDVKSDLDIEEILIPPMLIQPFVENAIRHGIMAVKRDGELDIQFKTDNHFLYATIVDNGIGINQSKQQKIKNSHQSMALQVTKERIEHLAGTNTLIIEEITDKNNKLAGTKVTFKIPLITDY